MTNLLKNYPIISALIDHLQTHEKRLIFELDEGYIFARIYDKDNNFITEYFPEDFMNIQISYTNYTNPNLYIIPFVIMRDNILNEKINEETLNSIFPTILERQQFINSILYDFIDNVRKLYRMVDIDKRNLIFDKYVKNLYREMDYFYHNNIGYKPLKRSHLSYVSSGYRVENRIEVRLDLLINYIFNRIVNARISDLTYDEFSDICIIITHIEYFYNNRNTDLLNQTISNLELNYRSIIIKNPVSIILLPLNYLRYILYIKYSEKYMNNTKDFYQDYVKAFEDIYMTHIFEKIKDIDLQIVQKYKDEILKFYLRYYMKVIINSLTIDYDIHLGKMLFGDEFIYDKEIQISLLIRGDIYSEKNIELAGSIINETLNKYPKLSNYFYEIFEDYKNKDLEEIPGNLYNYNMYMNMVINAFIMSNDLNYLNINISPFSNDYLPKFFERSAIKPYF